MSTDILASGLELAPLTATSKHTPIRRCALNGGVQYLFRFPNGFGASLVNSHYSYGNEIAVIRWDGDDFDLTYETPVTSDVLGHLDLDEIESVLDRIAALPTTKAVSA